MNHSGLPWIQQSWAVGQSSTWLQLLKGASSIISASVTPSLSLPLFSFADSTGEAEGF